MAPTPTGTAWARPDLSDVERFWTAPIPERAAAFAALRSVRAEAGDFQEKPPSESVDQPVD